MNFNRDAFRVPSWLYNNMQDMIKETRDCFFPEDRKNNQYIGFNRSHINIVLLRCRFLYG